MSRQLSSFVDSAIAKSLDPCTRKLDAKRTFCGEVARMSEAAMKMISTLTVVSRVEGGVSVG